MHHLTPYHEITDNPLIGLMFESLGYLSVAMFFYISGYGLMESYRERGEGYIDCFVKKRIVPFYSLIIVLTLLYWAENVLLHNGIEHILLLKSFLGGGTVIANGWYLQVQLHLYILFYLGMRLSKGNENSHAGLILLLTALLYVLVLFVVRMATHWYISVLAFNVGVYWSIEKANIESILIDKKRWRRILIGVSLLFLICVFLSQILPIMFANRLYVGPKIISSMLFVIAVILFTFRYRVANRLTMWLGRISLEIYIFQGIFLLLYRSNLLYIKSYFVYLFAVVISTLITAYITRPAVNGMMILVGNILCRKN